LIPTLPTNLNNLRGDKETLDERILTTLTMWIHSTGVYDFQEKPMKDQMRNFITSFGLEKRFQMIFEPLPIVFYFILFIYFFIDTSTSSEFLDSISLIISLPSLFSLPSIHTSLVSHTLFSFPYPWILSKTSLVDSPASVLSKEEACRAILASQGWHGLQIRDIAEQMTLSASQLYSNIPPSELVLCHQMEKTASTPIGYD
jgi:hypothetical protein